MKTRLFSFALIFFLSATLAVAQSNTYAKTSFAILGGINFQNLNGKNTNGDKLENDLIMGYHAGVNVQLPIAPEFYFQPGVLFTTKGAKYTTGPFTGTYNLSYVEMPLNLVYKALLGNGYFMLGFGPYVAYGIKGTFTDAAGSASLKSDIVFKNVVETSDPSTTHYLKALDAGGNIFVGYELPAGIFFQLNTQLGMLNINPEYKSLTTDKSSLKNTGFGLSLGYRF